MSNENPVNQSAIYPEPMKVGRFTIPPFTLHTAILLERVGCPWLTSEPGHAKVTIEDTARTLWVLLNQDHPMVTEIINDPTKLGNCVSELARGIGIREVVQLNGAMTRLMTDVDETVRETGLPTSEKKSDPATGLSG